MVVRSFFDVGVFGGGFVPPCFPATMNVSVYNMKETSKRCWIGVISKAHAQLGVEGGFIQLNHGKKAPLQRLQAEDYIIIYSSRESYPDGAVLQHFTAIGRIMTGDIYQVRKYRKLT